MPGRAYRQSPLAIFYSDYSFLSGFELAEDPPSPEDLGVGDVGLLFLFL